MQDAALQQIWEAAGHDYALYAIVPEPSASRAPAQGPSLTLD